MNTDREDYLFDQQYIRNKRKIKALRRKTREQSFYLRLLNVISVGLLILLAFCVCRVVKLTHQVDSLTEYNTQLLSENENLSIQFNACSELLYDVSEIAINLDEYNNDLLEINNSLNETIIGYEDRTELYDKYEYAIIRKDGTRTDVNYAQIENLQELTEKKGMSEETVDLVLSIVMTESDGIETAKNSKSTASGFGQFLSNTGKFVWERLMCNEQYNHDLSLDGDINLEMMVEYLCYLDEKYNGNMNQIINEYRGVDSVSYKNKINRYLANNNLSLSTIKITK